MHYAGYSSDDKRMQWVKLMPCSLKWSGVGSRGERDNLGQSLHACSHDSYFAVVPTVEYVMCDSLSVVPPAAFLAVQSNSRSHNFSSQRLAFIRS
jgi:hypothetical protein